MSIGPRLGSQLGGTAVYVSGPCFDETSAILCFFGDDRLIGSPGYYVSNLVAICVSPEFDTPGWKPLRVGLRNGQMVEHSAPSQFYAGM